ncbi:hypothetical protein PG985_006546 [Apiospora marii]|uniref:Uncharacterized protein n=1 Tax=Apiospora marii TaxID=335849 RepID=A0ABR1S7X5_9PEZI
MLLQRKLAILGDEVSKGVFGDENLNPRAKVKTPNGKSCWTGMCERAMSVTGTACLNGEGSTLVADDER